MKKRLVAGDLALCNHALIIQHTEAEADPVPGIMARARDLGCPGVKLLPPLLLLLT